MTPDKTTRLINTLKNKEKIRVLFVCLGNICRSPAAEGVMRRIVDEAGDADRWVIDSAGTGGWHVGQLPDKRMRVHGARRGLTLDHHCRQVRQADFDNFDLIVAMDDSNYADLRELAPTLDAADKIVKMIDFADMATRYDCIPDPYYEGAEGFELVLDLLDDACHHLYTALTPYAD
ncbi:MAG: low molecular weight phosphotyrosine protein phosphatase [Muribaculaceae bacterium]|nr:low molecular weight phosphotyrosine protein phosphatase [Muribaculaceae bacterium]